MVLAAPDQFIARLLGNRQGLAGDQGFGDGAAAFTHHAVAGNGFTRPDQHGLADFQGRDRHIFMAVRRQPVRQLRQDRAEIGGGFAGLLAGAHFQIAAGQRGKR